MHESTTRHIEIPPEFAGDPEDGPRIPRQVTPEDLERRRIAVDRILKRRERIGNIGINVEDLLGRHAEITPDELAHRQRIVARMQELSDRVGPIGIRADDLKHLARADDQDA